MLSSTWVTLVWSKHLVFIISCMPIINLSARIREIQTSLIAAFRFTKEIHIFFRPLNFPQLMQIILKLYVIPMSGNVCEKTILILWKYTTFFNAVLGQTLRCNGKTMKLWFKFNLNKLRFNMLNLGLYFWFRSKYKCAILGVPHMPSYKEIRPLWVGIQADDKV